MAAKPRVHEIASDYGADSKYALKLLRELGEYVKSPSSTIEPPVARKLGAALERNGYTSKVFPALRGDGGFHAATLSEQLPRRSPALLRVLAQGPHPMSVAIANATASGISYHVPVRAMPAVRDVRRERLATHDLPSPRGAMLVEEDGRRIHILTWEVTANGLRLHAAHLSRFSDERGERIVASPTRQVGVGKDGDEYASGSPAFRLFASVWAIIPESDPRGDSSSSPSPSSTVARVVKTDDETSIIYLHRPKARGTAEHDGSGSKATHRWTVSGHWRNQPYPTRGTSERIWIEEHTAGSSDGEVVRRDRVYVVAPPSPRKR